MTGSTHYGFCFFPEPKVRGASEGEPGVSSICPQGVPLLRFADNEAHSNGKYGLRIFTNGIADGDCSGGRCLPGYYPKLRPCEAVGPNNEFQTASFVRQFSWRNGKNGITVGSAAALHLVDAVVADNCERGSEITGADRIITGLNSVTKLRGSAGANRLIRPIFIGHDLTCPQCDRALVPEWKGHGADLDVINSKRLGLETPAWFGLLVENATFINCNRKGMVAVAGGFAKALPPHGAGYAFAHTTSLESNYHVRWRRADKAPPFHFHTTLEYSTLHTTLFYNLYSPVHL